MDLGPSSWTGRTKKTGDAVPRNHEANRQAVARRRARLLQEGLCTCCGLTRCPPQEQDSYPFEKCRACLSSQRESRERWVARGRKPMDIRRNVRTEETRQ
jgi:hypothetical protein